MKKTAINSPLGKLLLVEKDGYLVKILPGEEDCHDESELLTRTAGMLNDYFNKKTVDFSSLPLKPEGTPFQKLVYDELRKVPYGKTASYKDIAQRVARQMGKERMSCQAIGTAIAKNDIIILIPCHRIINHDGRIGGFSLGIDKKKILMDLEDIEYD